jgi:hypothetical protein
MTDFHKIQYLRIFLKKRLIFIKFNIWGFLKKRSVQKNLVPLKSDKNNGYLKQSSPVNILYCLESLLKWSVFRVKVVEKIKTHFMSSKFFSKTVSFLRQRTTILRLELASVLQGTFTPRQYRTNPYTLQYTDTHRMPVSGITLTSQDKMSILLHFSVFYKYIYILQGTHFNVDCMWTMYKMSTIKSYSKKKKEKYYITRQDKDDNIMRHRK